MAKITNDVIDVLDLPIGRRVLRISNKIEEGKIIWDDDASKDNIDH